MRDEDIVGNHNKAENAVAVGSNANPGVKCVKQYHGILAGNITIKLYAQ